MDGEVNTGYRVSKEMQCNGCKFCNFQKQGCFRGKKRGEPLRGLNVFTNATGYIALLRPTDCDYVREEKKPEGTPDGKNAGATSAKPKQKHKPRPQTA